MEISEILQHDYMKATLGGVLIGLSSVLLMIVNGRITGISGIINQMLVTQSFEKYWRMSYVLGLFIVGLLVQWIFYPGKESAYLNTHGDSVAKLAIAGFVVGFGTIVGSGCTSGHAVCGIGRLSIRSLVATVTFIGFGAITVTIMRLL